MARGKPSRGVKPLPPQPQRQVGLGQPGPDAASGRDLPALHRELGIPEDYATERRLPRCDEPSSDELRVIAIEPRTIELIAPAADAWAKLRAAAAAEGITLIPISGFRSIARQSENIRGKLAQGRAIDEILRLSAAPGFSEHHTGRALDLGTPGETDLEESFASTTAFEWLTRRAAEFGFHLSYPHGNAHGIAYEPWHWCWNPGPAAGGDRSALATAASKNL